MLVNDAACLSVRQIVCWSINIRLIGNCWQTAIADKQMHSQNYTKLSPKSQTYKFKSLVCVFIQDPGNEIRVSEVSSMLRQFLAMWSWAEIIIL
jgi:hypothetical protein